MKNLESLVDGTAFMLETIFHCKKAIAFDLTLKIIRDVLFQIAIMEMKGNGNEAVGALDSLGKFQTDINEKE